MFIYCVINNRCLLWNFAFFPYINAWQKGTLLKKNSCAFWNQQNANFKNSYCKAYASVNNNKRNINSGKKLMREFGCLIFKFKFRFNEGVRTPSLCGLSRWKYYISRILTDDPRGLRDNRCFFFHDDLPMFSSLIYLCYDWIPTKILRLRKLRDAIPLIPLCFNSRRIKSFFLLYFPSDTFWRTHVTHKNWCFLLKFSMKGALANFKCRKEERGTRGLCRPCGSVKGMEKGS